MSAISENCISIILTQKALKAVKKSHPWVYAEGIEKQNKSGDSGDLAILYDSKRKFVAIGLYDPESPIRIRILHRGRPTTIDKEWLTSRIEEIFSIRNDLINSEKTTGYRLISGENDNLPGLVLDRYADVLTLKLDTSAWLPHLKLITDIISGLTSAKSIVLRYSRTLESSKHLNGLKDGDTIYGKPVNDLVIFKENGILFEADPVNGQKTGFFLDQRNNRAEVEKLSEGRDVLNVFSYTGGFSLYAGRGDAKSVTSLDLSKPALDAAERNFKLNSDIKSPHHIICGDAFEEMKKLVSAGKKYGVVIVDPPSFARKQSDVEGAMKAYERLIKLALKLIRRNGILVAASCSSRVSADSFFEMINETVSNQNRKIREIKRTRHAKDHPIGFPEGSYLKCLYAEVL